MVLISCSSLFFLLTDETQPAFPSSLGHPDYIRRLITNNETLGELGHETK